MAEGRLCMLHKRICSAVCHLSCSRSGSKVILHLAELPGVSDVSGWCCCWCRPGWNSLENLNDLPEQMKEENLARKNRVVEMV